MKYDAPPSVLFLLLISAPASVAAADSLKVEKVFSTEGEGALQQLYISFWACSGRQSGKQIDLAPRPRLPQMTLSLLWL